VIFLPQVLRFVIIKTHCYSTLHGILLQHIVYVLYPVPGPSSPGSRDQRHRVYCSMQSRQPGLELGAFQSRQPELNTNFPVSVSPVILFLEPYSFQSIIACMPQFPGLIKCWIISGMLLSVSDCKCHLSYELCMKTLFIADKKLHVEKLFAVLRYCLIYFGATANTHHVT